MKRLSIATLLVIGLGCGAHAGDGPFYEPNDLVPGSPVYADWTGIYVGGQVGHSSANVDFGNSTRSLVSYILRNTALAGPVSQWSTLPSKGTNDFNYGGFVGFNMQWENAILGLEANYSRQDLNTSARDSVGPIIPNINITPPAGHTFTYTATVASRAAVHITDVLTLRGRAGWDAGWLLPYGFVGLAIGRADYSRFANVNVTLTDTDTTTTPATTTTGPVFLASNPQRDAKSGQIEFGFSAGIGIDIALTQNIFARGEWEYVQFPNIKDIRVGINTIRGGVGVKF